MSERLGQKLERSQGRSPTPGAAAPHASRHDCLVVDEQCGLTCAFQRSDGSVMVLPYHHFCSAGMTPDGSELKVIFAAVEVRITGVHLELIKDAIARGRNLLVRASDKRWKSELQPDEVFVSSMEITEKRDGAKPSHDEVEKEEAG